MDDEKREVSKPSLNRFSLKRWCLSLFFSRTPRLANFNPAAIAPVQVTSLVLSSNPAARVTALASPSGVVTANASSSSNPALQVPPPSSSEHPRRPPPPASHVLPSVLKYILCVELINNKIFFSAELCAYLYGVGAALGTNERSLADFASRVSVIKHFGDKEAQGMASLMHTKLQAIATEELLKSPPPPLEIHHPAELILLVRGRITITYSDADRENIHGYFCYWDMDGFNDEKYKLAVRC
ncbi:hypothetical protein BCR34DRAFT_580397, partial [Clohesyomyces aquaticus]